MRGKVVRQRSPFLTALLLAAVALADPLEAQTTGTIRGRVTDADGAGPVDGAQVVIVGTRMIETEAALEANDIPDFLSKLNTARAIYGPDVNLIPSAAERNNPNCAGPIGRPNDLRFQPK